MSRAVAASDILSVTINGSAYSQAFSVDAATTYGLLKASIEAVEDITVTVTGNALTYTANDAGEAYTLTSGLANNNGSATGAVTVAQSGSVANVVEIETLTLTDGTANTGLTAGDTMAVTLTDADAAAVTFTYTATAAGVDLATAATGLAALINANAGYSASAAAGVITITAAATNGNFTASAYTVTDVGAAVNTTGATAAFATTTANVTAEAKADTLYGNAGDDILTGGNLTSMYGGEGNDTFVVNIPTNVNSYSTIEDLSSGDVIQLTAGETFVSTKLELASTAVFQDYANSAAKYLEDNDQDAMWFQSGSDTFIVINDNRADTVGSFENGQDAIIKISGLVDLDTDATYNLTNGTLEIA